MEVSVTCTRNYEKCGSFEGREQLLKVILKGSCSVNQFLCQLYNLRGWDPVQRIETVNQIMSEQPKQQSLGLGESEPALGWVAIFSLRHQVSLYVHSSRVAVAGSHRELLEYLQPAW